MSGRHRCRPSVRRRLLLWTRRNHSLAAPDCDHIWQWLSWDRRSVCIRCGVHLLAL